MTTVAAAIAVLAGASAALDSMRLEGDARRPALRERAIVPAARGLALITEPQDGTAPVLSLIDGARRSVEMTMYELTDPRVEAALAAAATRGVRVRVLLDRRGWAGTENRAASSYLRAKRVPVRWAPVRFALTHQKSIEVDRRAALIMTFNLTPRYYAVDRDFAVLDRRRRDVAAIEATFAADWQDRGSPTATRAGATRPPSAATAARPAGDELVWSPRATSSLLGLIASARRSIQVESEEMDDPAVSDALCAAAARHVAVQVTMTYDASYRGALERLVHCGVEVHTYAPDAALYIHAKAIVVDGRLAFAGSQNLSTESLCCNRELGIVFSAAPLVRALQATLAADFAGARSMAPR